MNTLYDRYLVVSLSVGGCHSYERTYVYSLLEQGVPVDVTARCLEARRRAKITR